MTNDKFFYGKWSECKGLDSELDYSSSIDRHTEFPGMKVNWILTQSMRSFNNNSVLYKIGFLATRFWTYHWKLHCCTVYQYCFTDLTTHSWNKSVLSEFLCEVPIYLNCHWLHEEAVSSKDGLQSLLNCLPLHLCSRPSRSSRASFRRSLLPSVKTWLQHMPVPSKSLSSGPHSYSNLQLCTTSLQAFFPTETKACLATALDENVSRALAITDSSPTSGQLKPHTESAAAALSMFTLYVASIFTLHSCSTVVSFQSILISQKIRDE